MKQRRLSLEGIQSDFLNVDVEVKSRTDTAPLARALGESGVCLYVDRIGRWYRLRLTLARQPKSPQLIVDAQTSRKRAPRVRRKPTRSGPS